MWGLRSRRRPLLRCWHYIHSVCSRPRPGGWRVVQCVGLCGWLELRQSAWRCRRFEKWLGPAQRQCCQPCCHKSLEVHWSQ